MINIVLTCEISVFAEKGKEFEDLLYHGCYFFLTDGFNFNPFFGIWMRYSDSVIDSFYLEEHAHEATVLKKFAGN